MIHLLTPHPSPRPDRAQTKYPYPRVALRQALSLKLVSSALAFNANFAPYWVNSVSQKGFTLYYQVNGTVNRLWTVALAEKGVPLAPSECIAVRALAGTSPWDIEAKVFDTEYLGMAKPCAGSGHRPPPEELPTSHEAARLATVYFC